MQSKFLNPKPFKGFALSINKTKTLIQRFLFYLCYISYIIIIKYKFQSGEGMELLKNKASFLYKLYRRYIEDEVGNTAASLAYYLIFSFFPTIVFASMILGKMNISTEMVFRLLDGVLPADIIDIIGKYLKYLNENTSTNILMVSLFFTIYFPVRAMSRITDGINKAYKVKSKRGIVRKLVLMFSFTVIFVFSIGCIFLLLVVGRNLLSFVSAYIYISKEFIEFWSTIRFLIIGAVAFITLSFLYWVVPEEKVIFKEVLPGAFFSVVFWVGLSAGFSFYVERMGKYSILFGSIGAIIVLLVWLYMMSAVLLIGAEINCLLKCLKIKN